MAIKLELLNVLNIFESV